MRIASLLASGTEIVCALGLEDQLVAISHECDYPPTVTDRPRVSRSRFDTTGLDSGAIDAAVRETMAAQGSVYELDVERLRALEPDLILAQAVCDVCAVPTSLAQAAADALGGRARVLSLDSHTVEDILGAVTTVGEAVEVTDRAARVVQELRERIERVRELVAGAPRPRVLALEWLAPPFLPGHWTPEMVELAGGRNVVAAAGVPSRQTSWGALDGLDPDVLLVMPCGFGVAEARADADRHAAALESVAPRAVAERRAWVLDGSAYFNRSGPRTVDGIEILAALLHPDRCPDYELTGRAARWVP